MKKITYFTIISFIFITGCLNHQEPAAQSNLDQQQSGSYYTCPMHPTIVQEDPGDCPICGMDLVSSHEDHSKESSDDILFIDPVVVQNMGVRVEHALYRDITRNIRTIGTVKLAEDRLYSINLKFSGWIEKLFVDKVGQQVNKGEALFEVYSPELIAAQEEYLQAVNNYGRYSEIAVSTAKRLQLWGIPLSHLNEIVNRNDAQINPVISSPEQGFVLHKTLQKGSFIKAGKDLYHIGNTDEIWIIADVYEFDIPFLKEGSAVEIELTSSPGQNWLGHIDYVYPVLNENTRTQQIRIELRNNENILKPGMFAILNIESEIMEDVLAIPSEAIIHSGQRSIVFLSLGGGKYETREIQTGITDDLDYYTQVLSGLQENDIVVVSGQFLLDSESQLREAVQKLLNAKLENPTEMEPSNDQHSHEDSFYYTCPMHPNIVENEPGDCPICGMDLIKKTK